MRVTVKKIVTLELEGRESFLVAEASRATANGIIGSMELSSKDEIILHNVAEALEDPERWLERNPDGAS